MRRCFGIAKIPSRCLSRAPSKARNRAQPGVRICERAKQPGHSSRDDRKRKKARPAPFYRITLFRFGAGEGGGQAEGDECAAGDVSLGAAETNAAAKTVSYSAGEHGPDRIAAPAHQSKQDSQLENLQSGMP